MKGFWITLLLCLQGSVALMAQNVTLAEKNAPLELIFRKVQQQTGISFVYTKTELLAAKPVTLNVSNAPLEQAMDASFEDQPLTWSRQGQYIVVKAAPIRKATAQAPQNTDVSGRVTDDKGQPVEGAVVVVKGTQNATYTDEKGNYVLKNVPQDGFLIVRMIGFKQKEIAVKGAKLNIQLERMSQQIEEVVITTGLFNRKKESFTGATATFTGEQLKSVGNQDVVKSLRTLDPSFNVVPNNAFGSNPNARPQVEVRGQTGISSFNSQLGIDPNQPLFILDGFEVTLQQVVDLDINRVASITLLKDAASTAIYGAKAANGVVVIESRKPTPGQMRLSYTSDLTFDSPDLRDYNLMDAAEKLEFERLAGRYKAFLGNPTQLELDSMYNRRIGLVAQGVNTYWLKAPLKNAFSQRHSVYADGGDDVVRYGIGANYRRNEGVMKGSGRNTYGVNLDLIYRKGKFNISNKAFFTGVKSDESPYNFKDFAHTNPYYKMYDEKGNVSKFLEMTSDGRKATNNVRNPLYDATLRSYSMGKQQIFTDNLAIQYNLADGLQAIAGVSFTVDNSNDESFKDPRNAEFEQMVNDLKGRFTSKESSKTSWQSYLALNYGKILRGGHQVSLNLRGDATESKTNGLTTIVRGFPFGSNGNPGTGTSYDTEKKLPTYVDAVFRSASGIASGNYTWQNRFLADASFRYDASTSFGSNQSEHAFWSLGAGWNLHNEPFMRAIPVINRLKLFINAGTNSNQSYTGLGSTSVYTYAALYNVAMGQSLELGTVGNPDLMWPITTNTNMGFDLSLFKSRINATVNYFKKYTDDMVVPLTMPPSTGYKTYNINMGGLRNSGVEVTARITPWSDVKHRASWIVTLNGIWQDSKFTGLGNSLEQENSKFASDSLLESQFRRYQDGFSQYDLWSVRSIGIDPGSGKEVFLKLNGDRTIIYDAKDLRKVGSSRPTVEGVVGTGFMYEGFSFSVNFRYRLGGQAINTALFDKVENIDAEGVFLNQDRRALYDRWQKAGDIADFRSFGELGGSTIQTYVTSRFVQKENTFTGESISVGYEFSQAKWISKLGLKNLRVNAYMNEFVRWSTIRAERGTEYPFTRSGSLSVNASF
ncbi:SusC/RagA family TonB-linked outer membrane protein [Chitinophaga caseinilytica]|uniref:SusC/RagA family TonB-linked outer membrane protein n=1 Tax=Chitinophaga caseinilytica TaxID=2267521 RepID=UPI003C3078E0